MDAGRPPSLTGRFFPAGKSASENARLDEKHQKLVVTLTERDVEVAVIYMELGDRLGDLPRKIYFEDGSVFECPDNDAVDRFFGKEKHFFSRLTRAETSWRFGIVACVLTAILIGAIYRYGLPVMATFAAWATPQSAVELIDQGALDTVDRIMLNPSNMSDADKEKYTQIFQELLVAAELEGSDARLLFRDGGRIGPNALALPGGTVILTDQLAALAESEDELAGVFAHEIGHVVEQHSLRQIYRALGIGFMIAIVVGDTSQLIDNVVSQMALLDSFSYTRQFEADADTASVEIMLKAGRDPEAFVNLLDRVFASAGIDASETSWFSTHPGNEERRKNVQEDIERLSQ